MISLEFGLCLTPLSLLLSDSEPCRERGREGEREGGRGRGGGGEGEGGGGGGGGGGDFTPHTILHSHTHLYHTHIHIFYTHFTHKCYTQVKIKCALISRFYVRTYCIYFLQ